MQFLFANKQQTTKLNGKTVIVYTDALIFVFKMSQITMFFSYTIERVKRK